ncbi:TIGR02453 family protein [Leptospira sp. mixed culture ATI2-C-A1]|nr:TIGR02453 family protein [Leptospira sp. mixed culture ATI2-C-A1]
MKISKTVLSFLTELKLNNNRNWFLENKDRYVAIQNELVLMTGYLLAGIEKFDKSVQGVDPKSCIFRIYKDVRFSKDKSPYKTHIGIFLRGGTKKIDGTGYYLHIEPDHSLVGGGCYGPDPKSLHKIRERMISDTKTLKSILDDRKFVQDFGTEFYAEKLKTAPKGFAKDHPLIELLKYKGFAVAKKIKNSELTSDQFLNETLKSYRNIYPLNQFLEKAMAQK